MRARWSYHGRSEHGFEHEFVDHGDGVGRFRIGVVKVSKRQKSSQIAPRQSLQTSRGRLPIQAIERHEGDPPRTRSPHSLQQDRSGPVCIDDDVKESVAYEKCISNDRAKRHCRRRAVPAVVWTA